MRLPPDHAPQGGGISGVMCSSRMRHMRRERRGVVAGLILAALLAACSRPPAPPQAEAASTPSAAMCRVGPDGGPPVADRGIGGTGQPATLQAERGIGGTG